MVEPDTNIMEDGEPGDLGAAAADEFGGSSDIAADDPGAGGLDGAVGRTAGGVADLGVGGQSGPNLDTGVTDAGSIAADDAGAGRKAADPANGSGAD